MSVKRLIGFIGAVLICLIFAIGIMAIPVLALPLTYVEDNLSDYTAGATGTHTIAFTIASEIPKTGKIVISFPVGFDVSSVSLGSNPNSFSISTSGQDINLNRNANVAIPAGTTITVPLYNITNTPTSGTYHITVATYQSAHGSVIDGPTPSTEFSINAPAGVIITTLSLPPGQVGTDYSQTLTSSGGIGQYSWKIVSGALPSGLTLDPSTGVISGNPDSGGTSNFTVQVTDSASPPNFDSAGLGIIIYTPVTVTADAKTKTYGDLEPDLTYIFSCSDPSVSFSGALSRDPGEDVGSYAINQGTLSAGEYYIITFTSANLTITPQSITVTANALTKTYGDTDPDLNYHVTSGSLVFSDSFSGSLIRVSGENAGEYAILQGTLSLSNNYNLSYIGSNLIIGKRPVTVTADAQTKIYGDTDPILTYQITSGSLAFSNGFSGSLTRAAGENVGKYYIGQGTLSLDSNYDLSYVGTDFIITPKSASVTPNATGKIVGQDDPALTGTLAGFLEADGVTANYSRTSGETVAGSPYTISATISPAEVLGNYNIIYKTANFTIAKSAITVTVNIGQHKTYGDNDPELTYTGSDSSVIFTGALSRDAGEAVGSYAINQGTLSAQDYAITFIENIFTIEPRPVTVKADTQTKIYGQSDPALTYQITSGSLAFSDSFSGTLSRISGESVGTYSIGQGTLSLSTNYNLTYFGANLTISKATPIITWAKPADITNPAPLSSNQLNAISNVPGTFTYFDSDSQGNPLNIVNTGTILTAGDHKLWVKITPSDSTNYNEATASVTLTVKAAGSGGGGGGGGGSPKGTTAEVNRQINLSKLMDASGLFTQKATASSSDGFCNLIIPVGTIGKTSDGQALKFVTVEPVTNNLQTMPPPPGDSVIGLVYNFGPEGATFDPPINLSLSYDPNQIPAGIPEDELMIGYWDAASQKWIPLSGCQVDAVNHTLTAPLSHFSIYSIITFQPATITLSDLTIAPADVSAGQIATFNVTVSNTGELAGDYNLNLAVNGQIIETRQVKVPGQSSQTVSFNFPADKAGNFNIQINNLTQVLTVSPLLPVAFADLTIFPAQIASGSSVTIEATAANNNTTAAAAKVILLVDGIARDSQEITLAGNSQSNVAFKLSLNNPGTHTVEIAGLAASLKVLPADSSSFFKFDSLKLSPSIINEGEDVLVTALVTNSAETSGTCELILKINGISEETRQITLAGKTSELVSFKIQPQNSGSYDIDLNGLQDNLEVNSEAPSWYLILLVLSGVLSFAVTLIFILRRARRYGLYNI